jgi:DNA invertase Pin-like site-specific DNA recombinase
MDVACYVRVSTDDQSLERQHEATHDYAHRLGAAPGAVVTYRDKQTGTDTDRSGYQALLSDVQDGAFDAVVVNSVSRISRSIRDLDDTVDRIVQDAETALHIVSEGFDIRPGDDDPYQRALLQLLGVFAELEARMAQQRTKEVIRTRMQEDDYHHGPAPLGFQKNNGYLREGPEYDHVRATLELVEAGDLSKRKAASELDTSRRTLNRALDRPELYSL